MAPKTAEEKAQRKLELLRKKEEREAKKQATGGKTTASSKTTTTSSSSLLSSTAAFQKPVQTSPLVLLPDDALQEILCCLSARDLGCTAMTCSRLSKLDVRIVYLMSRLCTPTLPRQGMVGYAHLISSREDAIRLLPPKHESFLAYARMMEEQVCGYGLLVRGNKNERLAPFLHGRFVTCSPEHTVCRAGGGGKPGPGGSAVATWGVGKRGQLGHGVREDEASPKFLMGGIGYRSIRIVQVSAGGGLVRVAHTLLLTSTGRVLSFGTGQYGQLGHGYADGKQLPDYLRPKFIDGLADVRCICVSAGELHSAAVTADGDLYTWGDGFCGQLGLGNKKPEMEPVQVETGGLDEECVAMVSCGNRHTLCVTEDGAVYSFGLGHFGVLGRPFTPFEYDADRAIEMFGGDGDDEGFAAVPAPAPASQVEREEFNIQAQIDFLNGISLEDSSTQCIATRVDSLEGIHIVGASAGHRHSLFLDQQGGLYSCGCASHGALGHGDGQSQMFPMKVMEFVDNNIKIMQMSAGVDMSMVVTTTGEVYSWGKADGGRLGHPVSGIIQHPRRVVLTDSKNEEIKAIDVDCGYVHCLIVAIDGTIHQCGGVGIDGKSDGQQERDLLASERGKPVQVPDFNIYHKIPEPQEKVVKQERWKKYGTYELKGRKTMLSEKAREDR